MNVCAVYPVYMINRVENTKTKTHMYYPIPSLGRQVWAFGKGIDTLTFRLRVEQAAIDEAYCGLKVLQKYRHGNFLDRYGTKKVLVLESQINVENHHRIDTFESFQ